jgi:hypothetical protein
VAKTWKHLTQAEKIEDLRNDVLRLFTALREIASEQDRLRVAVSEATTRLDSIQSKTNKP